MEFAVIGPSTASGRSSSPHPSNVISVTVLLFLLALTSQSFAQNVQLTAEQRQILNQLPANQRQQVLERINRQENNSQQQSSGTQTISPLTQGDPTEKDFAGGSEVEGGSRLIIE